MSKGSYRRGGFYFIIILVVALNACSNVQEQREKSTEVKVDKFELLMSELTEKYPYLPKPLFDTISYKDYYRLKKRIFYPNDYWNQGYSLALNFELWEKTPCGGCWSFRVVCVYNDSLNFIIPLSDDYIYWKISTSQLHNKFEIEKNLSFEKEFNRLLEELNISDKYETERILDILMMDMQNLQHVTRYDIPKMELLAQEIQDDDFYSDSCRSKIMNNLTKVQEVIKNRDQLVYSNWILTPVIKVVTSDSTISKIEFTMVNDECLTVFLF